MRAITLEQIGKRGVFRVRGKTALTEGVVQEVSPDKNLFRIDASTWIENDQKNVLALLPDRQMDGTESPAPERRSGRYGARQGAKKPSCFGSRPGPQAQAENDCGNCEHQPACTERGAK